MRVAADKGHARERETALGTHNVNDAVVVLAHAEVAETELFGVLCQRLHLSATNGVLNGLILIVGGGVVVGHAIDLLGTEAFDAAVAHTLECLRRRYLVGIETIDVELGWSIGYNLHHVGVPYLVKQSVHKSLYVE